MARKDETGISSEIWEYLSTPNLDDFEVVWMTEEQSQAAMDRIMTMVAQIESETATKH